MNIVKDNKRLLELDFIKGIAIFLVFIGHAATDSFIFRPKFYEVVVQSIYTFHMGIFFIVSGFLDQFKNKVNSKDRYIEYVKSKFCRLMVPFISISIIIDLLLFIKELINNNLSYKYISNIIKSNFIYPELAVRGSLWFLYAAFFISILTPLIINLNEKYLILILILNIILKSQSIYIFSINKILKYFIYYILGVYLAKNYKKIKYLNIYTKRYFNKYTLIIFNLILVVYTLIISKENSVNDVVVNIFNLLITIIVIGFLQYLYERLKYNQLISKFFITLGIYSMDIYIFSWFFQLFSMMIVVNLFNVTNYTVFFISNCIIGGLCLPFSIIARKFRQVRKFILGIKN